MVVTSDETWPGGIGGEVAIHGFLQLCFRSFSTTGAFVLSPSRVSGVVIMKLLPDPWGLETTEPLCGSLQPRRSSCISHLSCLCVACMPVFLLDVYEPLFFQELTVVCRKRCRTKCWICSWMFEGGECLELEVCFLDKNWPTLVCVDSSILDFLSMQKGLLEVGTRNLVAFADLV